MSGGNPYGSPIFYVDITVRTGLSMEKALEQARQTDAARHSASFDQSALNQAAHQGFGNGACEDCEDCEEDTGAIVEEFFPTTGEESSRHELATSQSTAIIATPTPVKPSLAEHLDVRMQRQSPATKAH